MICRRRTIDRAMQRLQCVKCLDLKSDSRTFSHFCRSHLLPTHAAVFDELFFLFVYQSIIFYSCQSRITRRSNWSKQFLVAVVVVVPPSVSLSVLLRIDVTHTHTDLSICLSLVPLVHFLLHVTKTRLLIEKYKCVRVGNAYPWAIAIETKKKPFPFANDLIIIVLKKKIEWQ